MINSRFVNSEIRLLEPVRKTLIKQIDAAIGRHEEPQIYDGPAGDRGLTGGPGSMSWEINGDLASLLVAGTGAILMELLHPSVMAGVFTYSSYRTEPVRRTQNTLGYVLRTTFGNTQAATSVIESVKRVHARISGVRPDGIEYRALDPELIGWVHTCIPWAVMRAYDRYARPLSLEEKNRYLREQAAIGIMGGADAVPETLAQLEDYVQRMRPKLAINEQTLSFVDFVAGLSGDFEVNTAERVYRWFALRSSMGLMPDWARRLTGTRQPALVDRLLLAPSDRVRAQVVRWAYPELPCKRMALARVERGEAERLPAGNRAASEDYSARATR